MFMHKSRLSWMWIFGIITLSMNDFRFTLISVLIFIIIIGLGALAFYALEPGDRNGARQLITKLETQLADTQEELQEAYRKIAALESDNEQLIEEEEQQETEEPTEPTESSNPELLAALESLQSRGVILGPGAQGSDVGTIQKFLNVYNNTSGGVDNDFGNGTRSKVEAFQRDQNISVDGGVGPGTLGEMIKWLSNN
jgi:type II secretory pathway pseudopilin PulG